MSNQYRSVLAGAAGTGGDAIVSDVLSGKTFTNDNGPQVGTMANNGAVTQTLSAGQSYTIPAGYHNGSGTVTASVDTSTNPFVISGGDAPALLVSETQTTVTGSAGYGAVFVANCKCSAISLTVGASGAKLTRLINGAISTEQLTTGAQTVSNPENVLSVIGRIEQNLVVTATF